MKTAEKNYLQEEVAELLNFKSANEMTVVLVRKESGKPMVEHKLTSVLFTTNLIKDKALNDGIDICALIRLHDFLHEFIFDTVRLNKTLHIVFKEYFKTQNDTKIFDDFVKIINILHASNHAQLEISDLSSDIDELINSF